MNEKDFCPGLCREKIEEKIDCEIKRLEDLMDEREKAVVLYSQTQAAKEQRDQVERFVSKEEFEDKIITLRNEISGPLGLELRMRCVEQARGIIDAKMWMILLGIPLAVSAIVSTIVYVMMTHVAKVGG